ncbi:MAG: glycosyltransferase family 2 protein [Clostridia bacterium]|nr:glycosyltransferase family 2 protein [Clostridia bacterium]
MDLSVIVPVYNTEINILKKCLNSILEIQKMQYEVLVIDDGSNKEFSKEYVSFINNFNNVKYIYKNNGGVSSARNLGLKEAHGKYIMFVDSDDILYSKELHFEDIKTNAEIIFYNRFIVKGGKFFESKEIDRISGKVDAIYILEEFIKSNKFHNPFCKIISKSFLEKWKIEFDTNIIQGEDAIFNLEMLLHMPQMYYVDRFLYGYQYNYETYNNRWIKFPNQMFDNFWYLYSRKLKTIDDINFNDKEKLRKTINIHYLKRIFSVCLDISKEKDKNLNLLLKISEYINKIEIEKKDLKILLKLKIYLIINKKWNIICLISKVRNFYLKYLKRDYDF